MFRTIVSTILFSSSFAIASDLSPVAICLDTGYTVLKNHNAIVAAVLDINDSKILTFGHGNERKIFEIGSITKTFTANLLAQAVQQGTIGLSDSIPNEYQKSGSVISYQNLTTHSSGIMEGIFPSFQVTNQLFPFDGLTTPLFKELYAKTPLVSQPGEKVEYSNMGVALLGLILSEKSGRSYEDLVLENIFQPLRMNNSFFKIPPEKMIDFQPGFMFDDQGISQEIPPWDLYKTAINPAGGIRSDIGDMIKYARANLAPETSALRGSIELSQKPLVQANENGAWMGMNWVLQPDAGLILHNGRTYGFNSILVISKIKNIAIIALTDTNFLKVGADGKQFFDESFQDVAFKCIK